MGRLSDFWSRFTSDASERLVTFETFKGALFFVAGWFLVFYQEAILTCIALYLIIEGARKFQVNRIKQAERRAEQLARRQVARRHQAGEEGRKS